MLRLGVLVRRPRQSAGPARGKRLRPCPFGRPTPAVTTQAANQAPAACQPSPRPRNCSPASPGSYKFRALREPTRICWLESIPAVMACQAGWHAAQPTRRGPAPECLSCDGSDALILCSTKSSGVLECASFAQRIHGRMPPGPCPPPVFVAHAVSALIEYLLPTKHRQHYRQANLGRYFEAALKISYAGLRSAVIRSLRNLNPRNLRGRIPSAEQHHRVSWNNLNKLSKKNITRRFSSS